MLQALRRITQPVTRRVQRSNAVKQQVNIYIDCGRYSLKTANSRAEVLGALNLRYEVFYHELLGQASATGIDTDEFDEICDHLIILDNDTKEIVGTYRVICSKYSSKFYTATEFDIDDILNQPGPLLELGRACIKESHRKGSVMSLLWKGIGAYMEAVNAQLLFGCASVKSEDAVEMVLLYRLLLAKDYITTDIRSRPLTSFQSAEFIDVVRRQTGPLTIEERSQASKLIPPLLLSYFRLGAVITGYPAYDAAFKCYDFLTVLKREQLSPVVARKYQVVK